MEELSISTSMLNKLNPTAPWLEEIRQEAAKRFSIDALPTSNDELWRQTDPELFDWQKLFVTTDVVQQSASFGSNSVADGFVIRSGAELLDDDKKLVLSLLQNDSSTHAGDALTTLHLALCGNVTLVRIPKGANLSTPLSLSAVAKATSGGFSSLLVIVAEPNSSATIIEEQKGPFSGLQFARVECCVHENAELNFVSLQRLPDTAQYLARHNFHCYKNSRGQIVHLGLGAQLSRVDMDLRLLEEGADFSMISASVVDGERHLDFHPAQIHLAPHCRSDLYSKYVVKESGRSVYYGLIHVAEGAQKTDAYQTNRNLVLSPSARADAVPNLEIKANDVRCSHGASVSQVSEEELIYLRMRCLTAEQAERLLIEGFLADLLHKVKDPVIRDYLQSLVLERLSAGVEGNQIGAVSVTPAH